MALRERYDNIAGQYGLDIAGVRDGRTTRARLSARGPELVELLEEIAPEGSVTAETALYDDERRVWGVVDIMTTAPFVSVLDLKTGADATLDELPPSITLQMSLSAHLVQTTQGEWPRLIALFSLRNGLRRLAPQPTEVHRLIEELVLRRARWAADIRPAEPSFSNCQYCQQRLRCDPHWEQAESTDYGSVQGEVTELAHGERGRLAVLLTSPVGTSWLSDLREGPTVVGLGSHLRATFVKPRQTDGHGNVISWRATDMTRFSVRSEEPLQPQR